MKKHPGTSGLMPVKGSTCGIRPNLDAMSEDTGFDFSKAAQMLETLNQPSTKESTNKNTETTSPSKTPKKE